LERQEERPGRERGSKREVECEKIVRKEGEERMNAHGKEIVKSSYTLLC
jgi:hypothetical protein